MVGIRRFYNSLLGNSSLEDYIESLGDAVWLMISDDYAGLTDGARVPTLIDRTRTWNQADVGVQPRMYLNQLDGHPTIRFGEGGMTYFETPEFILSGDFTLYVVRNQTGIEPSVYSAWAGENTTNYQAIASAAFAGLNYGFGLATNGAFSTPRLTAQRPIDMSYRLYVHERNKLYKNSIESSYVTQNDVGGFRAKYWGIPYIEPALSFSGDFAMIYLAQGLHSPTVQENIRQRAYKKYPSLLL